MDFFGENAPAFIHIYQNYYLPYASYIYTIYAWTLYVQSFLIRNLYPILWPLWRLMALGLRPLFAFGADNPGLGTALVMLITTYIAVRVTNMLRRQVVALIAALMRMSFWMAIAGTAWYIYQRGWDQTVTDAEWLVDWLNMLSDEGREVGARKASQKRAQARSTRSGRRY